MKRGKSLADYDGMLVHLVIQARADGLGWVTCDYAHDNREANDKADALAADDAAWMPDTAKRSVDERRRDWTRIVPVGDLPFNSVRHAVEEHNRRRHESVNTSY